MFTYLVLIDIRNLPRLCNSLVNLTSKYTLISIMPRAKRRLQCCRDWYISVGVSSISPTFPRVPFHSNTLFDTSLTSPSPAVLIRRYSGTLEHWSSRSSISELSVCPYLIIVHSTTLVPSSFLATCLPQTLVISLLFFFRSF